MSLFRYLFGDFPAAFRTTLPITSAVGELAAASDRSTSSDGNPQLRGYATVNEVILWEGGDIFIHPFRPYFHGSFLQDQGVTVLSGVIRADWRAKAWCAVTGLAGPIALVFGGGLTRALGVTAIAVASFLMLRLSIHPSSRLVRSLATQIETTIAGK